VKNKKGFTLIELLVVIAIIGVLALLGLRAYDNQRESAMNSIAKANAATIQTMLVAYMGDQDIHAVSRIGDITLALNNVTPELGTPLESMINPYLGTAGVYHIDSAGSVFDADPSGDVAELALRGRVSILCLADNDLLVNARGKYGELIMVPVIRSLPASRY
jgi:prepilin-type N-terminal cleavage/methylation domain-containing protein